MKRVIALLTFATLMFALMAVPAIAHHDHQLHNPSGCVTIPVSHQDHASGIGNKVHNAIHVGTAVSYDPATGIGTLGQGNSNVWVKGAACPE